MSEPLSWDGLDLLIPAGMEPVILEPGCIQLTAPGQLTITVRMFAHMPRFDPRRHGTRILKAIKHPDAELVHQPQLVTRAPRSDVFISRQCLAVHFPADAGVAVLLFSVAPTETLLRELVASLRWTPPDVWRTWRCYGLQFETPPRTILSKASLRPGIFHFTFSGAAPLWLDRLAPARIVLGSATLCTWLEGFMRATYNLRISCSSTQDRVEFRQSQSRIRAWSACLPCIAAPKLGQARHDRAGDKLLVLTSTTAMPRTFLHRMSTSYVTHSLQD